MALTQQLEGVLRELYHPDGLNLGMNLGKAAGAGVAGHIHMHVLPRWFADVNFMSLSRRDPRAAGRSADHVQTNSLKVLKPLLSRLASGKELEHRHYQQLSIPAANSYALSIIFFSN